MTDTELGMELYVVLGNALNLLLRGVSAQQTEICGLAKTALLRLDATLSPIPPNAILQAIRCLHETERATIAETLRCCVRLAGTSTETVLGAGPALVHELAREVERMHTSI